MPYKKDLEGLDFSSHSRSILTFGQLFIAREYALNRTYTQALYKNQIMRSSQRLLPELLPDELPVHGTVSRKHNQDRSCCRTLQKTDLHRARHRYLHEGSD